MLSPQIPPIHSDFLQAKQRSQFSQFEVPPNSLRPPGHSCLSGWPQPITPEAYKNSRLSGLKAYDISEALEAPMPPRHIT